MTNSDNEEKKKVMDAVSQMWDTEETYRNEMRLSIEADNFARFRGLVNKAAAEVAGIIHEIAATVVSAAWTFVTTALFGRTFTKQAEADYPRANSAQGSCFVASCVYENANAFEVQILREIRDRVLCNYSVGRYFIFWYYNGLGEWASRRVAKSIILRRLIRRLLNIVVSSYVTSR